MLARCLRASQAALKGAVALCKRHSRDAAPEVSEALWFAVLQAYVAVLRDVRHRERAADERLPAGGIARGDSGDAEHRERLLLVQVGSAKDMVLSRVACPSRSDNGPLTDVLATEMHC